MADKKAGSLPWATYNLTCIFNFWNIVCSYQKANSPETLFLLKIKTQSRRCNVPRPKEKNRICGSTFARVKTREFVRSEGQLLSRQALSKYGCQQSKRQTTKRPFQERWAVPRREVLLLLSQQHLSSAPTNSKQRDVGKEDVEKCVRKEWMWWTGVCLLFSRLRDLN